MASNEFIPPLSDFGFKNLFGKGDKSKENLRFLLNQVLKDYPDFSPIVDIEYRNVEHQGESPERKSTRFDVYCKTEAGETFIIEMQNENDRHLKQRLIFYLCQAVTEQDYRLDLRKPWDYNFPRVLVIMFCNFIDNEIDREEINHFGILNLKTHREFGRHVGFTLIQLPLFPQQPEDCKTEIEKIVYTLTHMENIIDSAINPFTKRDGDFYDRVTKMSLASALNPDELHDYHQWLKVTNDDRLRLQRAEEKGLAEGRAEGREEGRAEGREEGRAEGREEGRAEGREEGRAEGALSEAWKIARKMKEGGMDMDKIYEMTGLPISELTQKLS